MKREKYTCFRCGKAAEYLNEISGALYCADCAEDKSDEYFEALPFDERIQFAKLTEDSDEYGLWYVNEDETMAYDMSSADDFAWEKFEDMSASERATFAGLVPLGDE